MLALDLDGTLVGGDLRISPRVKEAVARAQHRGVIVTIATGRMLRVTARFARELALEAPLICYQGALIQKWDAEHPLYLATMPRSLMFEAVQRQKQYDWPFVLYTADRAFVSRNGASARLREILVDEGVSSVDDLAAVIEQHEPVKFITISEAPAADRIERTLRRHFDGRMEVIRSHANVVEGYPLGVSKGDALARLAAELGISRSEVMAVGDHDNDASMIRWAGTGVAMGNASPAALAAADWVAPTIVEDGVAAAIERFILGA